MIGQCTQRVPGHLQALEAKPTDIEGVAIGNPFGNPFDTRSVVIGCKHGDARNPPSQLTNATYVIPMVMRAQDCRKLEPPMLQRLQHGTGFARVNDNGLRRAVTPNQISIIVGKTGDGFDVHRLKATADSTLVPESSATHLPLRCAPCIKGATLRVQKPTGGNVSLQERVKKCGNASID